MNGGKGDKRDNNKRDKSERESITMIYVYKERESKIETTTRGINSPFMYVRTHKKTTTITTTKTG